MKTNIMKGALKASSVAFVLTQQLAINLLWYWYCEELKATKSFDTQKGTSVVFMLLSQSLNFAQSSTICQSS